MSLETRLRDAFQGVGADVGEVLDRLLKTPTVYAARSNLVTAISAGDLDDYPSGAVVTAGEQRYVKMPTAHAAYGTTPISDMAGYAPLLPVAAEHFGFVVGDRSEALNNVAKFNAALSYCRTYNTELWLWSGSGFLRPNAMSLEGVTVRGYGIGLVQHTAYYYGNNTQTPCATQIVLTGTTTNAMQVHGISSAQSCGASRSFTARSDLDESTWKMVSFMNEDATTGAATVKDLAVGLLVDGEGGANCMGFRVVVDAGGTHGLDDYNSTSTAEIIGDVDIGILQVGAGETAYTDVQTLGHYQMAGYANVAIDLDGNYSDYHAPYGTTMTRCNFQGMRAFIVRGPDRFKIIAETSTTVDLPWADDHPFTLDSGHTTIRLTDTGTGTGGGSTFTYTGVSKVDLGGGDVRVRLSGLTSFSSGSYEAVVPTSAGGANSHIVFRDCQIGGLIIPAGWQANDSTALSDHIANGAIGGFEISGWRCAEIDVHGRLQHPGSLAGFIHDARETILDLQCEAGSNRRHSDAMTWIVSPQHNENTHSTHVAGGARWIDWRYTMVSERSASDTDFAPFMDFIPRPSAFSGGDGWFETYFATRAPTVRSRTDSGSDDINKLVAPALAVGPEAEGFNGWNPDGLFHVRAATGFVDAVIESVEANRDPRLFFKSNTSDWMVSSDASSGGDFVISQDADQDGTFDIRMRYEGGGTETGWHLQSNVWLEGVTTTDDQIHVTASSGNVNLTLHSNDGLSNTELRQYDDESFCIYAHDYLRFRAGSADVLQLDIDGSATFYDDVDITGTTRGIGQGNIFASGATARDDLDAILGSTKSVLAVAYNVPSSMTYSISSTTELVVARSASVNMTLLTAGTNSARINFADEADEDVGQIEYNHNIDTFNFKADAATRMSISAERTQVKNKFNIGVRNAKTIASGAITYTNGFTVVAPESGSADDLDTINGGADGDLLVVCTNSSSNTITLKDGTGNLALAGDFAMDNARDMIVLIYDSASNVWAELSRSNNAA